MRAFLLLLLAFTVALIICERDVRAQTPAASLSLTAPAEVRAGDPFTVTVVSSPAPPGGFAAFQAAVGLGGLVSSPPFFTTLWADCGYPAFADLGPPGLLYACVTSPIALSTYSGPLVAFTVTCQTPGDYALQLYAGAPMGSFYLDDRGAVILPELGGVTTVRCKSPCSWADLDGSGSVSAGDIGRIIAAFGQASPLDRDYDFLVSVRDIFIVVERFGEVC